MFKVRLCTACCLNLKKLKMYIYSKKTPFLISNQTQQASKQHEMKLIFKLGTLRPNGLNINFNFLWLWFNRALHRELKQQWFSVLLTVYFVRALSVRAYAYNFLYGVVKSTYWRRAKPETSSLQEHFWHFSEHFCLTYQTQQSLLCRFFYKVHTENQNSLKMISSKTN